MNIFRQVRVYPAYFSVRPQYTATTLQKRSIVISNTDTKTTKLFADKLKSSSSLTECHYVTGADREKKFGGSSKHLMSLFLPTPPSEHSERGSLVYEGRINRMVFFIKTFSLSTSVIGFSLLPIIINKLDGSVVALTLGGFMGLLSLATPLLLHWMTKRYVTHMYYNSATRTFCASTLSIFLRENPMKFERSDVVVPEFAGPITTILAKGKPLLLNPMGFTNREAFINVMKYDVPIDMGIKEEIQCEGGQCNIDEGKEPKQRKIQKN